MRPARSCLFPGPGQASSVAGHCRELAPASNAEFCPTCAVVGGITAQEIIKAVTGRARPMDNQFFFDAVDPKCPGFLQRNGAAEEAGAKPAASSAAVVLDLLD